MNILKKLIGYIKNKFIKHEDIKRLELPKQDKVEVQKEKFIKSIKLSNKDENEDVETLICVGDGLGIQKRLKST